MKIAIVTPAIHDPERLFGAERHFVGMVQAFDGRVNTTWIPVPLSEATWEDVLEGYERCRKLDVSRYDLVISTKNPTFMVQHPNHVNWLLHQIRVFYDRFDDEYGKLPERELAERRRQREIIWQLDSSGFQKVRRIFTNGYETARRLKYYNGFDADVLYPPVLSRGHYCAGQEYFLLPGRLHRWKRVDLAVRAMQHVRSDIPLLVPGTGEDEAYFRELAKSDSRIHFLGFVTDEELISLYANALAVLFVPKEEDFGYITIEAMLSHKPVIVCIDSGEPARLVQNGRSGFVVKPEPLEIAAAISILASDLPLARDMGEAGYHTAPSQSWDDVVEHLLGAGTAKRDYTVPEPNGVPERNPVEILVADNQVLDPPVGGGRIRIYELYRHIAALGFEVTYVGAYDWPGPAHRDQMLAPHFREVVTPLTQPHFAEDAKFRAATGGKTTIDVTIPKLLKHSPRYQRMAEDLGKKAEIVIISHPWVYPHVPRRPDQKLIYDAHNCEYVVKRQILGDTKAGRNLIREVEQVEGDLCRRADMIFICSEQDAGQFMDLYGVARDKMVLVPNGVDVEAITPATPEQRKAARAEFGFSGDSPVLIFIGSGYDPNLEAARFLVDQIAPKLPSCNIAIAGSVKDFYEARYGIEHPANVHFLGVIDADRRSAFYRAADIALNPMFSGSGTNLKMLDYFAAGLPVVSTAAGARGLDISEDNCLVREVAGFVNTIETLLTDNQQRKLLGQAARELAVRCYDWGSIAARASEAMLTLLESSVAMDK